MARSTAARARPIASTPGSPSERRADAASSTTGRERFRARTRIRNAASPAPAAPAGRREAPRVGLDGGGLTPPIVLYARRELQNRGGRPTVLSMTAGRPTSTAFHLFVGLAAVLG